MSELARFNLIVGWSGMVAAPGRRLLAALARQDVRWFTESDISIAADTELLALMRDSGCAQVLIGLEAATRAPLDGLERMSVAEFEAGLQSLVSQLYGAEETAERRRRFRRQLKRLREAEGPMRAHPS
jgi:hypothetical protein